MIKGLQAGLYLLLAVLAAGAIVALATLEPKAAAALDAVKAIEVNTTRTEAELAGLLNVTRQVALDERKATAAQLAQVAAIGSSTNQLIRHADAVLDDVDLTITGAGVDEVRLAKLLDQTTASVAEITQRSSTVLANVAQASDPAPVVAALQNVVAATGSIRQTTADGAATMIAVRRGVEYEVAQLMRPVRKVRVVSEEAVRLLGRFLGY